MGYRTTQRILECDECKETPDHGEYLWEMCGVYICAACIEKMENESEDENEARS